MHIIENQTSGFLWSDGWDPNGSESEATPLRVPQPVLTNAMSCHKDISESDPGLSSGCSENPDAAASSGQVFPVFESSSICCRTVCNPNTTDGTIRGELFDKRRSFEASRVQCYDGGPKRDSTPDATGNPDPWGAGGDFERLNGRFRKGVSSAEGVEPRSRENNCVELKPTDANLDSVPRTCPGGQSPLLSEGRSV